MAGDTSLTEQSRKLVQDMYATAIAGDMDRFPSYFDPERIVVVEPAFLPYGGSYHGLTDFLTNCISQAFSYMDVSTIKLETLVADGNQVVTFLRVQTAKHDSEVEMSEWFEIADGKIVKIRILFHQLGSLISVIKPAGSNA